MKRIDRVAAEFEQAQAEYQKCKPRSERRAILHRRGVDLKLHILLGRAPKRRKHRVTA